MAGRCWARRALPGWAELCWDELGPVGLGWAELGYARMRWGGAGLGCAMCSDGIKCAMCGVIRAPYPSSISLTGVRSRKQDPTPAAVSHTGVRIRNRCGVVFNSVSICLTGPGRAVWIRRACCGTPFDSTRRRRQRRRRRRRRRPTTTTTMTATAANAANGGVIRLHHFPPVPVQSIGASCGLV